MKIIILYALIGMALALPNEARAEEGTKFIKAVVRHPKPTIALYGLNGFTGARYTGEESPKAEKEANDQSFIMGVSGQLGLIATQTFGVQYSGVYRPFHAWRRPGPETIHSLSHELSFHFGSFRAPREAGDATFLFGTAFTFALGGRNDVPMAVAPFIGIDGMAIFRKFTGSAAGLGLDFRLGYRFTTEPGFIPYIDGLYGEMRTGLRLDIL